MMENEENKKDKGIRKSKKENSNEMNTGVEETTRADKVRYKNADKIYE